MAKKKRPKILICDPKYLSIAEKILDSRYATQKEKEKT